METCRFRPKAMVRSLQRSPQCENGDAGFSTIFVYSQAAPFCYIDHDVASDFFDKSLTPLILSE